MSSSSITPTPETVIAAPTAEVTAAPVEASLGVATDPKLGKILVGAGNMTLYLYTKDTKDTVTCVDQCLDKWPPLVTQGKPVVGAGVDATMVGTTLLPNGSKIVTYNHQPLYYWVGDANPGDTNGQGVGSVWYVVSPAGKMIKL